MRILLISILMVGALVVERLAAFAAPAHGPAALVEEVTGNPSGVEFMDYLDAGKVIRLSARDSVVLSYLNSCVRETIIGGIVTVGLEQSEVQSGIVVRATTKCGARRMQLTPQEASQSAGTAFRSISMRPQLVLYGSSPMIEIRGGGLLLIERIDRPEDRHVISIKQAQLLHGIFYDFATAGKSLASGGTYRATHAAREIVFKVDSNAAPGATPIVGRLLRFEPLN